MRSKILSRTTVCLCAVLVCGLLGVAAVSKSSPSVGISKPSFDLTLAGGVYSLSARDAFVNEILEQVSALSGAEIQVDPNLNDKVTLNLQSVALEDLLKNLTKSQAMVYERTGDGFKLVQASVTAQQKEIVPAVAKPVAERSAEEDAALKARGVLTNSKRTTHDLLQRDSKAILLQNAMIDTEAARATGKSVDVPAEFKAPEDTAYFIVQFDHTVSSSDKAALEGVGATVSHYVPNSAYAVHATPSVLAKIRALSGIQFIEPYHPYYKMSGEILDYVMGKAGMKDNVLITNGLFNVMTFRDAKVRSELARIGASVVSEQNAGGRTVLTIKAKPSDLKTLLKQDSIQWVEPRIPLRLMNDLGSKKIGASRLRALHPTLTGEGVVVGVVDSGIDFLNPGFSDVQGFPTSTNLNSRIVYYEARPSPISDGVYGDSYGHGTHVSGSIIGNGALSETVGKSPGSGVGPYATNLFAGAAPKAKLVMLEDLLSFTFQEQAKIAYREGARIANNSWATAGSTPYNTDSALWDALVRDADGDAAGNQEYTVLFAAGNDGDGIDDGTGGTPKTIAAPGNAKNVITVGAVEQPRYADNLLDISWVGSTGTVRVTNSRRETDSDWQIAYFSSRGPVSDTDLRVKPDIVAPGSYVLSVQSRETMPDDFAGDPPILNNDYRFGNVNSGTNFAFFSGTSMATPLAAGGAALIYQWYTNTYGKGPSPAMMKAVMVSGARNLNSLTYKHPIWYEDPVVVDEGWGMLDVSRSVDGQMAHASDTVTLFDQDQMPALNTGESYSFQVQGVAGDGGLKITLAWTDVPGNPANSVQLINDLDLTVYGGGAIYRGNRFAADGVHSHRFTPQDPVLNDHFNNVETVVIPDMASATYTIIVRGNQIPNGPQDFALAIMKGIGLQSRTPGNSPDIALDTNDSPVVAYVGNTGAYGVTNTHVYVRKWVGQAGGLSELGQWKRLEDQWFEVRNSASGSGVSRSFESPAEPTVAVKGDKIYVAWTEKARPPETLDKIFFRMFDGSDWVELGNSAHDLGISGTNTYSPSVPVVAVDASGNPIVAWRQKILTGFKVYVAHWNNVSSNWEGYANSHLIGVGGSSANGYDMVANSSGNPVVAWEESTTQNIQVRQWNGAAWVDIGSQGLAPYAATPRLAAGPAGTVYLTWLQYPDGVGANIYNQIYASRYSGGWSAIGTSMTPPNGVSYTTNNAMRPYNPSIGVAFNGSVVVSWQSGSNIPNSILSRRYNGVAWSGINGSEVFPGIAQIGGLSALPALVVDSVGMPIVTFQNSLSTNVQILTYALIGDRHPPIFGGLDRAIGGTNNNVQLYWPSATDDVSSAIIYRVYRSTSWWSCGSTPVCSANDVFSNLIATVTNLYTTNLLTYNVTGLVANRTYCYGVRAGDTNGLFENNVVTLSAAAISGAGDSDGDCLSNALELAVGTDACNPDTDADGMRDGWEWFYSTNNPAHTNALAMDPLDSGAINYRNFGAGKTNQLSTADIDGDGASNLEEFQWYVTYGTNCAFSDANNPDPTRPDTDGDSMPDGWEMINGLNPMNPADAATDLDGDGLSNLLEYQWGSDPRTTDSDADGLSDGNEVNIHLTDPSTPDTDRDGLDDNYEVSIGSNPHNADVLGHGISDGDMFQLGWNVTAGYDVLNTLMLENFETASRTNWTHRKVNAYVGPDLWHLSQAEPSPSNSGVNYLNDHTPNTVYAYSTDSAMGTNWAAGYSSLYNQQRAALESPRIDAFAVSNLFVEWNEFYSTEPNADFVQVFGRAGANTNWYPIGAARSGQSGVSNAVTNAAAAWIHSVADFSRFAGQSNVQVRFLFSANDINNHFPGWYVDDVRVYEGVRNGISGWVRDNNGAPIEGAIVQAIGRGNVTNILQGHKMVLPGKVFGEARTANDGSYTITGLPLGRYYLKASEPTHQAEFYNGPLFTNGYGFGHQLNPGVYSVDLATNGWLNLSATGTPGVCHFELELGRGRAYLGVMSQGDSLSNIVYVSGVTTDQQARIWNGVANPVLTNFTVYRAATNAMLPINYPDWISNAVAPNLLGDLAIGRQVIYVGTNLVFYALPVVDLRDGEITLISVGGTNFGKGFLDVSAEDGVEYSVLIDGRGITNRMPFRMQVFAGTHEVKIASTNNTGIAPKIVSVPAGSRAIVMFSTNDTRGTVGAVNVLTKDSNGNDVKGATVYLNGVLSGTAATNVSSYIVSNLRPGAHDLTVRKAGYRQAELRRAHVFSSLTNVEQFILYDADEDYDLVGDSIEVQGYTNIFKYARNDDPDADGLNNLYEFDQFRLFDIQLNPFDPDTDHDRMSDGAEVNYDGITNLLAVSVLDTNTLQGANEVRILFVGQYLAGVCNFGMGNRAVSIEGDRFECSAVSNTCDAVPTAQKAITRFLGIPTNVVSRSVTYGHNKGALVFADGLPDRVDTDEDGMWDGFEAANGLATIAKLDVIEASLADEDPDADGLINYEEFLGRDWTANTNDWLSAINPDSDGDEMPDGWEMSHGLNPLISTDAFADADSDLLQNVSEFFAGTSPKNRDTDADFLPDGAEVITYGTDPLDIDTDRDGLLDGREVWDKNLDGIQDGGFFPMWAGGDLDGDGYVDGPTDWDTDGDGMPDGFEVIDAFGNLRDDPRLDPFNPYDGDDDPDGDGLSNLQEYLVRDALYGNNRSGLVWDYSSDPFNSDSDGDGMPDGWEVVNGLHPMDPIPISGDEVQTRYGNVGPGGDLDGDGLWNGREFSIRFHLDPIAASNDLYSLSTDPWNPDTDGDGLGDGEEDRTFRANPILQDSDGDRLMDGASVTTKWSEVDSVLWTNDYLLVSCPTCTWLQAYAAAQVPYPGNSAVIGHLAAITTSNKQTVIEAILAGATNVAIGGYNPLGEDPHGGWRWITGPRFSYTNWDSGQPTLAFSNVMRNYLRIISNGYWSVMSHTQTVSSYLIEWSTVVPVVTNHYDQALNDLWRLTWPKKRDLPSWQRVTPAPSSPLPAPRWGSAMTYIPVFETKNPKNDNYGTILLDNRKIVLIGGRDGVTRHKDVWEFDIRSNAWSVSSAALDDLLPGFADGLSEVSAVPLFIYKNTKQEVCECNNPPPPYDCDGTGFLLPKNRPWSDSRSFDWTFVWGGWSDMESYNGPWPSFYKSKDMQEIREKKSADADGTEFVQETYTIDGTNAPTTNVSVQVETDNRRILGGPRIVSATASQGTRTVYTTNTYLGTNSFVFTGLNGIGGNCDVLLGAELEIPIAFAVQTQIDIAVFAEFDPDESMLDVTGNSPSERFMTRGWYFNSSVIYTNIPAGTPADGVVTVQVFQVLQQALSYPRFNRQDLGFVIYSTNSMARTPNLFVAEVPNDSVRLSVRYKAGYAVDPYWSGPGLLIWVGKQIQNRKSVGMAYDYERQKIVIFGGIDGKDVFGDTFEGEVTYTAAGEPNSIKWTHIDTVSKPPARWGHSLVYDHNNQRTVLFGGFDSEHRPLNDLWAYRQPTETVQTTNEFGSNVTVTVTNDAEWFQISNFEDTQRPQPRGGASMVYYGDYDYDRGIGEYFVSANKRKVVMFGGTDGNTYFNDTWVFDDAGQDGGRWVLVNPVGEQSQGPSPRAFASIVWAQNGRSSPDLSGSREYRADATTDDVESEEPKGAKPAVYLFGGRSGTLPTGQDTDYDMVNDGAEYELGGPAAGRDPRINRLVQPTQTNETIPYAFNRVGSLPIANVARAAVANFESLNNNDNNYAVETGLPSESHLEGDRTAVVGSSVVGQESFDDKRGVDARRADQVKMWFHRYGGEDPFDARDVWDVGVPDGSSMNSNGAPPYAHSGRWVYGTGLRGPYPNDSIMELFSPLMNLRAASPDSTNPNNMNSYFLVFHEWLDLKDSNDVVRIEAVRPETPADINTRQTGANKPVLPVLPNRNNMYNTLGKWRQVIVPLDTVNNESNVFFRFTLQSDTNGVAGGWYIDDVAILQAAEIAGMFTNMPGVDVVLYGENYNGNIYDTTFTDGSGLFMFGFLPLGNYVVGSVSTSFGPLQVTDGNTSLNIGTTNLEDVVFTDITGMPRTVTWPAVPGVKYRLQYTYNLLFGPWYDMADVVAAGAVENYSDWSGDSSRYYRIWVISSQ